MRSVRWRWLTVLLGLVLCGSGVAVAQSGFVEAFPGTPSAPQPYPAIPGLAAWDVAVHSRDASTSYQLEPMDAQHGPACQGPPATHPLSGNYADAVFACANHIMTAISAGGYGVIYLTPPVVADWTDTPAVIQWDMSTARTSQRDWIDLWVSPYATHLAVPLDAWLPDLSGIPPDAVHLRLDTYSGTQSMFSGEVFRAFGGETLNGIWWAGYESFLTPDAARRDTFQLTISRTHIKFGMPAYNFWWFDTDIADLGWSQGVVQLGHHSYNPHKDCPAGQTCGANTWHWDNVNVTPSSPFTITRATEAYRDPSTGSRVTFPAPAGAGSHLQWWGVGTAYELSVDSGASWTPIAPQPSSLSRPELGQSYWAAVPAGTQAVDVRAQGGWWGPPPWIARDFALWGQVAVPPSQRTPTPTSAPATPTRTRTPTPPPSLTPGPTATDLPTPTLPPLPTATPTGAPTAIPTSPPRCGRIDTINGGQVYTPLPDGQCFQQ